MNISQLKLRIEKLDDDDDNNNNNNNNNNNKYKTLEHVTVFKLYLLCLRNVDVREIRRFVIMRFNPLNAELNPICHLLALLGGATIVVISRLRVNEHCCQLSTLYLTNWNDSK